MKKDVLDKGFVRIVEHETLQYNNDEQKYVPVSNLAVYGSDNAIVQAARTSYGKGTKNINDDRALIRYLLRNEHTSPFEMAEIKLHMKMPIFVARQIVRHRTANLNEVSGRYSILKDEFYIPDHEQISPQSKNNKQGRDGNFDTNTTSIIQTILKESSEFCFEQYNELLDEENFNLARELSRIILPLNTYTEWYWKIDIHNLLHFLKLRLHPHAQYETRMYAQAIYDLVQPFFPLTFEAFDDYVLNACKFSKQEMNVLLKLLNIDEAKFNNLVIDNNIKGRELEEFKTKIGISK